VYHIVGRKSYVKEDGCFHVSLRIADTNLVEDWKVPARIEDINLDVGRLETILQGPFPTDVGPHGKIEIDWNGPWGREFLQKYGDPSRAIRRSPRL